MSSVVFGAWKGEDFGGHTAERDLGGGVWGLELGL